MQRHIGRAVLLAFLFVSCAAAIDLIQYPGHFEKWYVGWQTLGPDLLQTCHDEYELYLTHSDELLQKLAPGDRSRNRYVHKLLDCMLSHTDELVKVEMATSGIILGLLPTLLIFVTPTCIEFGLLAQRRPILATLLAAASPGLAPIRFYEYYAQIQFILAQPDDDGYRREEKQLSLKQSPLKPYAMLISVFEYLIAVLAIANIATNTWQLTVATVAAFSAETAYSPTIWICVALGLHIFEMLVISLRFRRTPKKTFVKRLLEEELRPCAWHEKIVLRFTSPPMAFRLLSWMSNIGTIVFILWGTFFFSSVLFTKIIDALNIAGRYLVSVVVCRLILQYELEGMSTRVTVPKWMGG